MTLVDYTDFHERRYSLWLDWAPDTNPHWPFAIKDGNRDDEIVTRAANVSVVLGWLDAFRTDANVTVDLWSVCEATRKASIARAGRAFVDGLEAEQHSVKVRPKLRVVENA